MPGVIIFDPRNEDVGFSVGNEQAAGVYLDIEDDAMYFSDTVNIYQWEGNAASTQTYTWRSGKIRLDKKVNLGAAIVEADSYDNTLTFKLYADGTLITSIPITSAEPVRLPGGYLSNLYEVEVIGQDVVTGISAAENIFELAKG